MEEDQLEVVKFLIERGADINAVTFDDELSPINIAKMVLGDPHPITELLLKAGAKDTDIYVDREAGEEEDDDDDDDDEDEDETEL